MMNGVLLDFLKNTVPKNIKNKFKITEKSTSTGTFPPGSICSTRGFHFCSSLALLDA